jgi:hypothetical protein
MLFGTSFWKREKKEENNEQKGEGKKTGVSKRKKSKVKRKQSF